MQNNNQWNSEKIPDQSGKIAIVTGANSGIGYETALALAQNGAMVVLACRNMNKANQAANQIRSLISPAAIPGGAVVVMQLDLADLESARQFAAEFQGQYNRLDLLINNAGIMVPPYGKTAQGFETQFGVNHLGHFALTGHLIDLLIQTPQARVVTVSSQAHRAGRINFEDLNWDKNYSPAGAYGQSKLANLMFTYELQRKLSAAGTDTLSVAAHPGWTETNLQAHAGWVRLLNPFLAQTPAMGALPTLYAATAPDVQGGDYYGPSNFFEMRGRPKKVSSNRRSHDKDVAARLWDVSETLTGVRFKVLAGAYKG